MITRAVPRDRRRRADAGRSRLAPVVVRALEHLLGGRDRPPMAAVLAQIGKVCKERGCTTPSRAALYAFLDRMRPGVYRKLSLPEAVRQSLYNLDEDAHVPGDQVVFYAFNHGDTAALSFASGMPWLCLKRALDLRGWRPKSRSLLQSVISMRGI